MAYPNGQIPRSELIVTASGTNEDGYWEHQWTPGTLAKWRALVADVHAHEGVTLYVTPGWNVFRPLHSQYAAKAKYGPNAAAPGFSSHGGFYNGRECMAVDVANWGQLGRAVFYHYASKHGFVVNEFDWEPWHIIDYSPRAVPAGLNVTPIETPEEQESEEDDMANNTGIYWKRADGVQMNAIVNTQSGYFQPFESADGKYNTAKAQAFYTPSWAEVSESDALSIERACAATRDDSGTVTVIIGKAAEVPSQPQA